MERAFRPVSDADLWQLRTESRTSFVDYIRERLIRQLAERGAPSVDLANAAKIFHPAALTIGFARRFAAYKRPNLLLHDPDRLARILSDRQRPVQLVVAGKAHPRDAAGQALIEQWMGFVARPDVRGRVVFLSDYDMLMAERFVQGIDLWINTPRRPWEACGTSGMKVLVNGGLNLSELDGWWAEAYVPEVGWAIGDRREHDEDAAWDASEADRLYGLLENEIVPSFYTRGADGIPSSWVARMRESMARLTPVFSANRTVREYTETHYLPLAAAYRARAAEGGEAGATLLSWKTALERGWASARFRGVDVSTDGGQHTFRVSVDVGSLDPDAVRVELYAEGGPGGEPIRVAMSRSEASGHRITYSASVPASRPAVDVTPRLVPQHPSIAVPLEAPLILWDDQRR
jgi:starch phosphorylase